MRKHADRESLGKFGRTLKLLFEACHDAQQRTLARTITAKYANLGAGVKGQVDLFEHLTLAMLLGEVGDLEDVLLVGWHTLSRSVLFLGKAIPSLQGLASAGTTDCSDAPRSGNPSIRLTN